MLLADLPEAAGIRVGRHALEHHRGGAIGERAIDDIAVPGDPADIRGTPENVAVLVVERVLMRHRGIDQITTRTMHHTLGLPRRTRGVEDEQRVFGTHRAGRTIRRGGVHQRLDVHVPAIDPCGLIAGMLDHKAAHLFGTVQQRLIGIGLERRLAAPARGGVRRYHHFRVTAVDPRRQRVRRKARKDNGVDRADARTGQHRIGRFGDHWQVDDDPIPAHDALRQKHIGHAAGFFVQFAIGDVLSRGVRVIWFPDDGGLVTACGQMTVDAIGRDIQNTILEPLDVDIAWFETGVLDLCEGLYPVNALRFLGPEPLGVGHRSGIQVFIGRRVRIGIGHHVGRRRIGLVSHVSSPFGPGCDPGVFSVQTRQRPDDLWRVLDFGPVAGRGPDQVRWPDIRRAARRFQALLRHCRQKRSRRYRGSPTGRPVPVRAPRSVRPESW